MEIKPNIRLKMAAVIFAAAGVISAQQQATDPYNPQNRRVAPADSSGNQSAPSLMNMGIGVDEGNMGPFVTVNDKQFTKLAAIRSMMEIRLGQAAVEKGSTDGVRRVGQRILDDYTKWSTSISGAAARLNIAIPSELDAKHQMEVERITALSGGAFDKAFLAEMIRLQNRALTETEFEATNAGVAGFRRWASAVIPTMQDELKAAKQELGK